MPTEHSRMQLLQVLSEKLGPDAAAALMECVPPFPWTEIATKSDLNALEERMDLRLGRLEATFFGKFDHIDGKFDRIDGKFEALEGKFEGLEGRLTALIEAKTAVQNRALLLAVATAIVVTLVANLLR